MTGARLPASAHRLKAFSSLGVFLQNRVVALELGKVLEKLFLERSERAGG